MKLKISESRQISADLIGRAYIDIVCMEASDLIRLGYDIIEIRGIKFTDEDNHDTD